MEDIPNDSPLVSIPALEQIVLPTKSTDEVDWEPELACIIGMLGDDIGLYRSQIAQFNRMRMDMKSAPPSAAGLDMAVTYFRQLEALSKRFQSEGHRAEVVFAWRDAFDDSICQSERSFAFEKANVLFNIGALLSNAARKSDTARNYQSAASTLAAAAGVCPDAPLNDIRPHSLMFLSSLMLAQAQESVVLEASSSGKKSSVIAKLAAAAHSQWHQARNQLESHELAELRSCLLEGATRHTDRDAYSLIKTKTSLFAVIAEYFTAVCAYDDGRVGEGISRLASTVMLADIALRENEFDTNSACVKFIAQLKHCAEKFKPKWEKENLTIYSQIVPEASALPKPPSTMLVKIVGLDATWAFVSHRPDIFQSLLPLSAHVDQSLYSEEKSKLLRFETMKATVADSDLQNTLAMLEIVPKLEAYQQMSKGNITIPDQLRSIRDRALSVDNIFFDVAKLTEEMINSLTARLENEIRLNQDVPSNSTPRTSLKTQTAEIAKMMENVAVLESKLVNSVSTANKIVSYTSHDHEKIFKALISPLNELTRIVPCPLMNDPTTHELVENLRLVLGSLEKLQRNRVAMLDKFRQMILEDAPSPAVIARSKQSEFEDLLAHFDDICNTIEQNIKEQSALLKQLKDMWNDLRTKSMADSAEKAFTVFIDHAMAAVDIYEKRGQDLAKFVPYIKQLHNDVLGLQDVIEKYCSRREIERQKADIADRERLAANRNAYLLEKLQSLQLDSAKTSIQADNVESDNVIENAGANHNAPNSTTEPSLLD